jgi:act minimal PKS acyl carrier protein
MASIEISIDDLTRILREGAGTDEGVDLDGEIMDTDFNDLGYDSLAMLETAARIGREYGITVDDNVVTAAHTPRELLKVVNSG